MLLLQPSTPQLAACDSFIHMWSSSETSIVNIKQMRHILLGLFCIQCKFGSEWINLSISPRGGGGVRTELRIEHAPGKSTLLTVALWLRDRIVFWISNLQNLYNFYRAGIRFAWAVCQGQCQQHTSFIPFPVAFFPLCKMVSWRDGFFSSWFAHISRCYFRLLCTDCL